MAPTELALLEQRYRRTYELARLRRALLGFVPMLILIATAVVFGGRPATALIARPAAVCRRCAGTLVWARAGRGVLPGALAGGAALVLVLCANQMGHFCTGERCVSWCLPACVAGGLLAGGAVSVVGVRERRGFGYWLSSSAITLLVGALGCSCVGFSGMIGLGMGFLLVTVGSALAASMRG